MSGFNIKLEIHNLINEYIKRFQNNLEKIDVPLEAIGNYMKTSIEDTFRDEGPNWKKLAASTIKQRRRGKHGSQIKILQDTTRLKQSIDFKVEGNQVSIGPNLKEGSNVKYAAIHQFGRTIRHPGTERLIHFRKYKRGKHKGKTLFSKEAKATLGRKITIGSYTITIPPRPYIVIRKNDPAAIGDIMEKHVIKAISS